VVYFLKEDGDSGYVGKQLLSAITGYSHKTSGVEVVIVMESSHDRNV